MRHKIKDGLKRSELIVVSLFILMLISISCLPIEWTGGISFAQQAKKMKEYIHANGKLIAIEEAQPTVAPISTPTPTVSPIPTPTPSPDPNTQIVVYEHGDFQGKSQGFGVGTYSVSNLNIVGNDLISSLRVPTGLMATLCEHGDGSGLCKPFLAGNYAWLGDDLNDRTSYIKVSTDPAVPSPPDGLVPMLYWSSAGPIAGKHCIQTLETSDPNTWSDNYLCTDKDYGFVWKSDGPVSGMKNIQWLEAADPHSWYDNFLATPYDYGYQWSASGPIAGMQCVQIYEGADPHTWYDNYICWSGTTAPTPTPTPQTIYNANYVSQSLPDYVYTNEGFWVSVTMNNSGNIEWPYNSNFALGSLVDYTWGTNRAALPYSTGTGGNVTFDFYVLAPLNAGSHNHMRQVKL
jgi:hypothetical protein